MREDERRGRFVVLSIFLWQKTTRNEQLKSHRSAPRFSSRDEMILWKEEKRKKRKARHTEKLRFNLCTNRDMDTIVNYRRLKLVSRCVYTNCTFLNPFALQFYSPTYYLWFINYSHLRTRSSFALIIIYHWLHYLVRNSRLIYMRTANDALAINENSMCHCDLYYKWYTSYGNDKIKENCELNNTT